MAQSVVSSGRAPVRRRARGSISRLPSGSLRVRVYVGVDPVTGRQGYLSETVGAGPTAQAQAEQACRRLLGRVQRRRCLRTDATVNEVLDRHLALVDCTERTRESYEYLAGRHIRPFLGRVRLWAVTPEQLDGLYADVLRCREHCPPRSQSQRGHVCRPLSPATVRKIHYVLSAAFGRAVRWGWIDRSPTSDATVPRAPHPEPQPPTPSEAARIVTEAWPDPDLRPLVWLAMATGARRGELCALRWRHIDTARGVLVIRSAIAQAGGRVWEKDTKLHQRRHIALDPESTAILDTYHQERQRRAAAVGVDLPVEGFVFSPRADARRCRSPQAMTSQYRRLVSRLGIRTSLHKLRHYSATELIRAGVDVRTVAGRLGHSVGGTTLAYYAAWVQEADQRACRILMGRLPLPTPPQVAAAPARPVRPPNPYEVIAAELRRAIIDGILRPGTALPPMKQLAARHQVAASTIHRAIALLATEQLVTVSRGRRAIIRPPNNGVDDQGRVVTKSGHILNMLDEVAAVDGHLTQGSASAASGSASIAASPRDLRDAAVRAWARGLATARWVARSAITGVEGDRHAAEPSESGRRRPVPVRPAAPDALERQGYAIADGWRRWLRLVGCRAEVRGMGRGMKPRQDQGLVSARVTDVVTNDAGDGP